MIKSLYLSLICFFLISCNQNNDLKNNVLLSNKITFDAVIHSLHRAGDTKRAKKWMLRMEKAGFAPSRLAIRQAEAGKY